MPGSILIIEDEEVLARNMHTYLARQGYEVHTASSAEDGIEALAHFHPDAVVLDFNLPGMNGMEAIARLHAHDANISVIMVTGHGNIEMAVEAMKCGALDFLTKPASLAKLRVVLDRAITGKRRDNALDYYRRRDEQAADLAALRGESRGMRQFKDTLLQLIQAESHLQDADAPAVLITGETGTGKELAARALHYNGPRREKPFIELNCAALPAQLLESELFGYERGAFTDARERKLGLVETAEGGTLFLDEIGDMELAMQAKILKLLEERTVRRLGSVREQRVNVRIVAATHRPLEQRVRDGLFRADLYFRLRVVELALPPLRARGEDIVLLARDFVGQHALRYGRTAPVLTANAERVLLQHAWPGNVRELRNVLEQAVLLCQGDHIDAAHLTLLSLAHSAGALAAPADNEAPTLPNLERAALVRALEQTAGNVSRAARVLGVSRDTLRYRIDKYGLGVMRH